jgi:hypothetical protein
MTPKIVTNVDDRQVLVHLGNRYVLFGSEAKLPAALAFSPKDIPEPPVRVPYEDEVPAERLVNSIRMSGGIIKQFEPDKAADIAFEDKSGNTVLIEVKVRERDLGRADYQRYEAIFQDSRRHGISQEVWNFNVQRLHLEIAQYEQGRYEGTTSLRPLDVWEFNEDGSTFHRVDVLKRVENWAERVRALYDQVVPWAANAGLKTDQSRKVLMSEELMQQFAVPDRELPVLDILKADQTVASFVPVGLWLIGANGRIDIVTLSGSYALIDRAKELSKPDWVVLGAGRREFKSFDETEFGRLVGNP